MKSEVKFEDQFATLKEEEYRLFDPSMFKNINTSAQAAPQQGDKQQFYQIQQELNIVTKDVKKLSNKQSIIDRFNNWDQPFLEDKDHYRDNSLNLNYNKLRDYNTDINDLPQHQFSQKQSQITQKKIDNYAESQVIEQKRTIREFMESPMTQQKENLIRNLQIQSEQRQKYNQSYYFSKKNRRTENREIQQILDSYKKTQDIPQSKFQRAQIKTPQKPCKFCDASKIKLHRQQIQFEARANKVSYSPARSLHQKYLNRDYKVSSAIIQSHLQPRLEYLQQGRLKAEYLKTVSEQIDMKLSNLNRWKLGVIKSNESSSSVRKKIFQEKALLQNQKQIIHIKIQDGGRKTFNKGQAFTPLTQKTFKPKRKEIYRNIFVAASNKKEAQTKKKGGRTSSLNFDYIKTSLVGSRIKIFNSKNSKGEHKSIRIDRSNSPERLFASPFKKETADIYANMNINTELKKWISENKLSISVQTQKILRYELIRRYLSREELEQKLRQMVQQKMKPKRWLLTLVDEVYSRLKNRYFPN